MKQQTELLEKLNSKKQRDWCDICKKVLRAKLKRHRNNTPKERNIELNKEKQIDMCIKDDDSIT